MGQGGSHESNEALQDEFDEDESLVNTLDELQILVGHDDLIRVPPVVMNHQILATAGDDCTIRLWNYRTGLPVAVMRGHTRPITCLFRLSPKRIASGSSDEKICIWNVQTGKMVRELKFGPVQCIIRLSENRLCSGGSDPSIVVWDQDGNEVGRIERHENENLSCMISVANRIITGSSSSLLMVYDPETWAYVTVLAYHREAVTCLERVGGKTQFASGSLDGSLVIWHADTLKPVRILAFPAVYRSEASHAFLYHIRSLQCLNQRYLVVATGNGFALYDLFNGEKVLEKADAHDAACLQALPLYRGRKIITCSDDATIRVWGLQELEVAAALGNSSGNHALNASNSGGTTSALTSSGTSGNLPVSADESGTFRNLFSSSAAKKKKATPIMIGEMDVHAGAVNALTAIDESSFVSVGNDALVVLWKDGRVQRHLRNNLANASLLISSPGASALGGVSPPSTMRRSSLFGSESAYGSGGHSPQASSPSMAAANTVSPERVYSVSPAKANTTEEVHLVPEYIYSFALLLRQEKGLSIPEVLDQLRDQGHASSIVDAIERKLKKE